MTNPISAPARTAARATAERLTGQYGPGLPAEVETALRAQGTAPRPSHFLDPVSLGSLIVTIASLAWSVYSDKRKKTPQPVPDDVTPDVRADVPYHSGTSEQEVDYITEIVVVEIIQADRDPG